MKKDISVVILTAGSGTRMLSKIPKALHQICGRSMLDYILQSVASVTDKQPILVTGYGSDAVAEKAGNCYILHQEDQLGAGHAVMMATPNIDTEYSLVLPGDTPLILGTTLLKMIDYTVDNSFDGVVISVQMTDPIGYDRVLRHENGDLSDVIGADKTDEQQRLIREAGGSIYCFRTQSLVEALKNINQGSIQKECCLTDIIKELKRQGKRVGAYIADDYREILDVNTRVDLSIAEGFMRQRINEGHMLKGVTIIDSSNTYIGPDVKIGQDTIIYPGNVLEGSTVIGEDCVLYPNNRLADAHISDRVKLQSSVILESHIGSDTTVGPYAYIRPGSNIGQHVKIGDFVEIKNSTIGHETKISHLTYIGDAELGQDINVGCGVVTVNYDGRKKHKTIIGDKAFIGCNVNLVAPVEVEKNAYIAAGSTITDKVPSKALAIARARQVNKEGWVDKKRT